MTAPGNGGECGTLFLVATPIGNLEDITPRALEVLRSAGRIAAEDTREARKILSHFGIPAGGRLTSCFRDNEKRRAAGLVSFLRRGGDVALVSSRGTPGISDPACLVVKGALAGGIRVTPVPGASSLAAALSVCGQPTDRFFFAGFLPRRGGKRRSCLETVRQAGCTAVIYESPFRFLETMAELNELLGGERPVTVCRELTKKFEEIRLDTLSGMLEHFRRQGVRGEMIIVIGPPARGAGRQAAGDPDRARPAGDNFPEMKK